MKGLENDTLVHLVRESRTGNINAFQKLVETTQGYAYSLAIRYLGSEEDAGDVVQEAFIKIWKNLGTYDYRCKFTTWMYRIVINQCSDRYRANSKIRNQSVSVPPDSLRRLNGQYEAGNLEDENIKKQLAAVVTKLATQLTPRQRAVFVLRDLQNERIDSVSQILGISKGAVKSNLTHARRNIRLMLENLEKNTNRGGVK
jgi:RNA polymerase sigma-70 factor, ECF subfamily